MLKFCFHFVSAIELDINVLDARKPYLPFEEFYNEPLSDTIEMDIDFANYKTEISNGKFFIWYGVVIKAPKITTPFKYEYYCVIFTDKF